MAKVTDADLQLLKDLINERFDDIKADNAQLSEQMQHLETAQTQISQQMEQMSGQIRNLEMGQAKIETRMDEWKRAIDKIPDLAEKVGELKNWRQIALVIITATFGGFMGWFIRSGNPNP